MYLMHGRMTLALGFSTVAHVGLVWMMAEHLPVPSSAAPAQRAMTVAMTPAAPRTVLNSIAPSAVPVLSPAAAAPIEPTSVRVVEEPDSVITARAPDGVEVLDAPLVEPRRPERTQRLRDAPAPIITAVAPRSDLQVSKAAQRERLDKPLPAELVRARGSRARSDAAARRVAANAPAREVLQGGAGSGTRAHSATSVAGQPGADRSALPASGNEPPQYPWAARAQGQQGRVVLSVWVSAEGEADALSVLRSSGYPLLDRAALEAVEHWRFRAARRAGHDTASMLYVPVVFRLDDD